VIGLKSTAGDNDIRSLPEGVSQEELQFAYLVAGGGAAGEIVPLDPDLRSPEELGKM
jgi:hypothetical protein